MKSRRVRIHTLTIKVTLFHYLFFLHFTAIAKPVCVFVSVVQGRAKQLVRVGYKTIRHLAHADPSQLTESVQHLPMKIAQQIVAAAKVNSHFPSLTFNYT